MREAAPARESAASAWERRSFRALMGLLALAAGALLIAPTLIVLITSFTSGFSLKFPPPGYSSRWYLALWNDSPEIVDAFVLSLQVAGLASAVSIVLAVAAALALARRFAGRACERTVRFVLFVNEEPPFFFTDEMGSHVYASACKARGENIVAMMTPETIGYYSDDEDSQKYPIPVGGLYPTKGNFIAFVGMHESARLIRRAVGTFRRTCQFPSIGAGLPSIVPMVGASDHWSFWCMGYPSLMITDTAPFRYPHYHTRRDTPDKIDFGKMARVVEGIERVTDDLVNGAAI